MYSFFPSTFKNSNLQNAPENSIMNTHTPFTSIHQWPIINTLSALFKPPSPKSFSVTWGLWDTVTLLINTIASSLCLLIRPLSCSLKELTQAQWTFTTSYCHAFPVFFPFGMSTHRSLKAQPKCPESMQLSPQISWPVSLSRITFCFLLGTTAVYVCVVYASHPWIAQEHLRPKSVSKSQLVFSQS